MCFYVSCFRLLDEISDTLDLLLSTSDIIIGEQVLEENESFDTPPYKVRGCVLTMVERLDEEFTKLLKECDPHSNEYVER
jgi:translation initiation factor 3 subunit C